MSDDVVAKVEALLMPPHRALGSEDWTDSRPRCIDIACGVLTDREPHKGGCAVAAVIALLRAEPSRSSPDPDLLSKIGALAGHPHYLPMEVVAPLLDGVRRLGSSPDLTGLDET